MCQELRRLTKCKVAGGTVDSQVCGVSITEKHQSVVGKHVEVGLGDLMMSYHHVLRDMLFR